MSDRSAAEERDRRELERMTKLEMEGRDLRRRVTKLEEDRRVLRQRLAAAEDRHRALRERVAVRVALWLAELPGRIARLLRRRS